jgi:hypothetical protein
MEVKIKLVGLKYPSWNWLKSTSHVQLERQLSPLEEFLNNYITNPPAGGNVQTAKNALKLVNRANDELSKRRVQEAWALYYDAELLQYNLIEKSEIEARAAKILFCDTSNLDDGSKKRIRRLIGEDAGNGDWKLKTKVTTGDVIEARRVVQDHYNDKYTNLGLSLKQLAILATVALLLSLVIIPAVTTVPSSSYAFNSLSAANFTASNVAATDFNATNFVAANFTATDILASSEGQVPSADWLFWLVIGLFGAVGGSISGLYGLKQAYSAKSDIPERVLNNWITLAKPIVGFAAAVVIAVFIIGGLVQAADLTLSNYVIYAMAFISGFSERLIIGAVEERLPS